MKDRISSVATDLLSFEAKIILLKHTVRAIPIFWMSMIGLTQVAVAQMDSMCLHFLWGWNESGKAKVALIAWKRFCRSKSQGGLGLKDLSAMGKSLLCKKLSNVLCDDPSTWSSLLAEFIRHSRAKYNKAIIAWKLLTSRVTSYWPQVAYCRLSHGFGAWGSLGIDSSSPAMVAREWAISTENHSQRFS